MACIQGEWEGDSLPFDFIINMIIINITIIITTNIIIIIIIITFIIIKYKLDFGRKLSSWMVLDSVDKEKSLEYSMDIVENL